MSESDFQLNLEEALDQQPKVMLRNPFGSNDTQVYFSSEERNQQLGMLEHLSRYSNLLSVVMGQSGSGKTRFLQEFIRLQSDTAIISHVNASMLMTAGQLLQSIYAGYADVLDSQNAGTSFGPLLKFSHEMEAKGQKAIILIDNAHELNTDAVIMLMDMMSLATESQEVPHVALFSEHSLGRNLDAYQQNRYQQLSHELTLEPFSLDQTRAYMLHRVRAIGGGINLPFNEKQIKKIYQQSQGLPGRINQAALAMMGDKKAAQGMQPTRSGSRLKWSGGGLSFGFPVVHMALLSVVMLGILVAVIFSGNEESVDDGASTRIAPISQAPRQASAETIARIEKMQRQIGQQPLSLPPISANSTSGNTAPVADNTPTTSSVTPAPLRDTAVADTPTVAINEPEDATPAPEAEPKTTPSSQERDPFNQTQRWLDRNPNRYTLQLLGTHNQATVKEFIRDQGSLDAFSYFQAEHKGRDWYVVVYGEYRNRSEAIAAVENLPGDLGSLNPWARSVRGIQQDIRRANGQ